MIANGLMLFGVAACVLLALYLWKKDKVDAWFTRVRGTKGGQQAVADIQRIEGALLERLRKVAPPDMVTLPPSDAGALSAAAERLAADYAGVNYTSAARAQGIAPPAAPMQATTTTKDAAMNLTRGPYIRPSNSPSAILMLRDFKSYAAAAQNFLDLPTIPEKFLFWTSTTSIWPLQKYLGVNGNWINALSYDGLANGVMLPQCHFDKAANKVTIDGKPVDNPTLGWATADGQAPAQYKPLGPPAAATGADILAMFLKVGTQSSYLRGLGLTQEAIDAARAA